MCFESPVCHRQRQGTSVSVSDEIAELQISSLFLCDQMIERLKGVLQNRRLYFPKCHYILALPTKIYWNPSWEGRLPLETIRFYDFTDSPFNDGYTCLPLEHCSLSQSLEELSFNGSQWESVDNLPSFSIRIQYVNLSPHW
jgi:hypothetical protein